MNYIILILFLFIGLFDCAHAQQTVFNVPSADITPPKTIFLQHESQFRPWTPGAFWLGTHYSALGVGHNSEVTATLFNLDAPSTHNLSLGVGFKSAMPVAGLKEKFPEREIKVTIGSEILFSLDGNGIGNWTYAHLSGRLPVTKTRLTAGLSYGTKQIFAKDTLCFICAVEQPITEKLNIIADWYSGTEHFVGFLIAGFSYQLPKNTMIYVGFQIPNGPKAGNSGFVVELSRLFDLEKLIPSLKKS